MARLHSLALALALSAAGCAPPAAPVETAAPDTLLRTFHDASHGLSLDVPAAWQPVSAGLTVQFKGPDGWVALTGLESLPTPTATDDPGHRHDVFAIAGQTMHVVTPTSGPEPGLATAPLPAPIRRGPSGPTETAIELRGDAPHLAAIARSIRFERDGLAYARGILDVLRAFHYRHAAIDWAARDALVAEAALGEPGPAEAVAAVRLAFEGLGEAHSAYFDAATWARTTAARSPSYGLDVLARGARRVVTRVRAGSPAEAAGMRPGDVVTATEPIDAAGQTVRVRYTRPGEAGDRSATLSEVDVAQTVLPTLRLLEGGVAYLEVPGYVELDPARSYHTELARLVASAQAAGVRAWIVDVRRNSGGLVGEMISGLVPMLGEGRIGGSESVDAGTAIDYVLGGELYTAAPELLPALTPANPPVAVLTSPMTASAGEFVAAAFVGRPRSRTFGEPTVGLFTQMRGYPLWDGAYLNVAVGRALDAAGAPHDGPLVPDEAIDTTFVGFGTDTDPVLQRARAWLAEATN